MKKKLTEKIVYEPNDRIKVTVENKPVYDEGKVTGYERTVTFKVKDGFHPDKLSFGTDEDIEEFIKGTNFEDPQQSLV